MDILLAAIPFVLGIGFVWTKVGKVMELLKEVSDVLVTVTESLGDKTLSKEEIEKIKKEALEVAGSAKALVGK